jgi:hypothetical protein
MRKRRSKVGDVIQLTLEDGTYAYGRVLRDGAVAFYRHRSEVPNAPPIGSRDYQFVVGVYDDVLKSEQCPVVGRDHSEDLEDEWPPEQVIRDVITGKVRDLYHKGVIRKAIGGEGEELEPVAAWGYEHVVDRLMGRMDKIWIGTHQIRLPK